MLSLCTLLLLPLLTTTGTVQAEALQGPPTVVEESRDSTNWMRQGIFNVVEALLPVSQTTVEARRKKKHKFNKYLLPLIVGFMLIKSILLPIALKTLAILSGKAVVLSLMSLILAAIVGLKKVAQTSSGSNYEVVNLAPSKYRRQDMFDFGDDAAESEPYKFYRERRRKK